MPLTTTQHSALGDLKRFGHLFSPAPRQRLERGTPHGFSRRTLQALVDQGYAVWAPRRDGVWPHIVAIHHPACPARHDSTKYKIIRVRKSLAFPKEPIGVQFSNPVPQSWDEAGASLAGMVRREPELYKFLGTDMVIRDSGVSITVYRIVPSDFEIEED